MMKSPSATFGPPSKRSGKLLTEREAEVACLRAEGLEFVFIAKVLRISPDTARTYLKFAYYKIGVSRQAELSALLTRLLM